MEQGFEGMDKVIKQFSKVEKQFASGRSTPLMNSLYGGAKIIKRAARAICPVGETGKLKASIVAKKGKKGYISSPHALSS